MRESEDERVLENITIVPFPPAAALIRRCSPSLGRAKSCLLWQNFRSGSKNAAPPSTGMTGSWTVAGWSACVTSSTTTTILKQTTSTDLTFRWSRDRRPIRWETFGTACEGRSGCGGTGPWAGTVRRVLSSPGGFLWGGGRFWRLVLEQVVPLGSSCFFLRRTFRFSVFRFEEKLCSDVREGSPIVVHLFVSDVIQEQGWSRIRKCVVEDFLWVKTSMQ